jgi:hypothetical protein
MKPEQLQYQKFKKMWPGLLPQRHEDKIADGVPDVSFVSIRDCGHIPGGVCGFVELKTINSWSNALTKIPHLRPGQINWLRSRGGMCKYIYLLLWVRECDEWLWVPGSSVSHIMRDSGLSAAQWRELSV